MKPLHFLIASSVALFTACTPKKQTIALIELPNIIEETSGLAEFGNNFLTHNDSGGTASLYEFNDQGILVSEHPIIGAVNRDWEDLAQDENYFYIADIGNNSGKRKDLTVYKTTKDFELKDSIKIKYQKQKSFKKNKKTKYNAETLIAVGDSLVLFSKNMKSMNTHLYVFPKDGGSYSLSSRKKFKINTLITGGDYHAESQRLVLTGYRPDGINYLLKAEKFKLEEPVSIEFEYYSLPFDRAQVEAVKIKKNKEVWISSEGEGLSIPFLYRIDFDSLKK
ncbi:MAG: hypothetical protein ACPH94_03135 [Flavobacteriaceae bacterium]